MVVVRLRSKKSRIVAAIANYKTLVVTNRDRLLDYRSRVLESVTKACR
jgi:hypothetical protein